jgi:hypothetical protein
MISTIPFPTSEAGNSGRAKNYFSQRPMPELLLKYSFSNEGLFVFSCTSFGLSGTRNSLVYILEKFIGLCHAQIFQTLHRNYLHLIHY